MHVGVQNLDLSNHGPTAPDASDPPRQLRDLFTGRRLTPVQRRIAVYIMAEGPTVAFQSSVDLANQVGVSQPSVTRFALTLGYSGYPEFQKAMQDLVLDNNVGTKATSGQNKVQRAFQSSIELLTQVQQELADSSTIQEAAQLLAKSPVLPVYGARSARPPAIEFQFFASKIHPDVRLLSGSPADVLEQLASAHDLGATAILAVALPRYPAELSRVLTVARQLDIKVVLVTDSIVSPASELGDLVIGAPISREFLFNPPIVPMQILAVMLDSLADVFPSRTSERIERFERRAVEEGYFLGVEYGSPPSRWASPA